MFLKAILNELMHLRIQSSLSFSQPQSYITSWRISWLSRCEKYRGFILVAIHTLSKLFRRSNNARRIKFDGGWCKYNMCETRWLSLLAIVRHVKVLLDTSSNNLTFCHHRIIWWTTALKLLMLSETFSTL